MSSEDEDIITSRPTNMKRVITHADTSSSELSSSASDSDAATRSSGKKAEKTKQTKKKKKRQHSSSRPKTPAVTTLAASVAKFSKAPVPSKDASKSKSTSTKSDMIEIASEDEEAVQYLQAGKNAYMQYHLNPQAANKTSKWWKYYLLYDKNEHKEKMNMAKCRVVGCAENVDFKNGSNGLKSHIIRHKHSKLWDTEHESKPRTDNSDKSSKPEAKGQSKMTQFGKKMLSPQQQSEMFLGRVSIWTSMK